MPMRNEPKSLRESAMVTIARHFDYLCYKCDTHTQMRAMIEDETFLDVVGPFQNMPPSVCIGLQHAMSSVAGCLRKHHIHGLLHSYQDEFRISGVGDKHFSLELAGVRCSKLKKLDLSYLCHMSPVVVINMIPNLTNLVVLNMKMTEMTDQILGLVGKHCPEIRDLDCSHCPITNQGLFNLCYDKDTLKPQSRKLLRICVIGCLITAQAVCFMIQEIPTIRELEYENTFQVFNLMANKGISLKTLESSPQAFHLSHLTSTDDSVNKECAEIATVLCPFATSVTIFNSIIQNDVLYKIMNLQNLNHLRLTNNDSLFLDFYEGVLPVLTVCGNNLLSLLLSKFTVVDIAAIGESCPKLQNLALSNISIYEEILYPRENLFTELTALEIWTELQVETMNSVILKQLLSYCPNIHNLLVSGSQALTDKLLFEVWKMNEMKELTRVTIENCPNISKSTVDNLLDSANKLVLIRIWGCFLVSKQDSDCLQKRVKNENCDTYLEWYSWCG